MGQRDRRLTLYTMKLLYIDESHDKKHYALCGFLINDINYRKLNADFNIFLKREFELSEDRELKAMNCLMAENFGKKRVLMKEMKLYVKFLIF